MIRLNFPATASSAHADHPAGQAVDGDSATYWHTPWGENPPGQPHTLTIDFGGERTIAGFTYLPRQDGTINGTILDYRAEVSRDGGKWREVAAGDFGNIRNYPVEQTILFDAVKTRYFRLTSLAEASGAPYASTAGISLLGPEN